MRHKNNKKAAPGFTLVELGIVVAIGSLLLGFAVNTGFSVFSSARAEAEIDELSGIVTNIQRTFQRRGSYEEATQDLLIGMRVFPEARVAGNTVHNRYHGVITASPTNLGGVNDGLALTTTGIPAAECIHIIQGVERLMRVVKVGATEVKADGQYASDPGVMAAACRADAQASITFVFGR